MSKYKEEETLNSENRVTFDDLQTVKKLIESKKLTEKQKQALQRLYATYMYISD